MLLLLKRHLGDETKLPRGPERKIMSDQSGLLWVHPAALVTDTLLSMCVVAPLVVGYWRGTWFLLDTYLYPADTATSCWISLAIGLGTIHLATWFQMPIQKWVTRQPNWLYFLLSRLYTIVFCLSLFFSQFSLKILNNNFMILLNYYINRLCKPLAGCMDNP